MSRDSSTAAVATAAAVGLAVLATRCRTSQPNPSSASLRSRPVGIHPWVSAIPPLRSSGPRGLTVATLNILLKEFAGKAYAEYVAPAHRDWATHRLPLLFATLANLDADIITLQEASVLSFATDIAPFLASHGYALVAPYDKDAFKKNRDLAKPAILYRPSVVTLTWTHYRSRAVLAAFAHNATGAPVYVIDCHLEGNPVKAKERFLQVKSALTAVDNHWKGVKCPAPPRKAKKNAAARKNAAPEDKGTVPGDEDAAAKGKATPPKANEEPQPRTGPYLIVAGDFNSTREHCVHTLLSDGILQPGFRDSWGENDGVITDESYTCPYPLQDVYHGCRARPGTYVGETKRAALIDFIFASEAFAVDAVRPPCDPQQLADALRTGTPNAWCVSDHFPLAAALRFPLPAKV